MQIVSLGDIGTPLDISIIDAVGAVDLSTATLLEIQLKRPDGSVLVKTAQIQGVASAGTIRYTVQTGDLSTAGIWTVRAHIAMPAGSWTTLPEPFAVV